MVTYLITPTEAVDWRISVDDLDTFLRSRWPEVERQAERGGQRAHLWTFGDRYELWVPADREVACLDPVENRAASVAAHLAASGPSNLILMDDGNHFAIKISGVEEAEILGKLRAI